MPVYDAGGRTKATHPFLTVKSPSPGYAVVRRAHYWKESVTAGVVERASVNRCNNNGVTPADVTEKKNTRSRAAIAPGQTWATAPTLLGNPLVLTDVGDKPVHQNTWRPPRPYAGIWLIDAEEVGLDATSGSNTSTDYDLGWAEHDPGIEDRQVRGRRPRNGYWHHFAQFNTALGGKASTTVPKRTLRNNYVADIRRFRYTVMAERNDTLYAGGGGPWNMNLALLSEVDALTAIAGSKDAALGLLTTSPSLLAITPTKSALLAELTEIDALLAAAAQKDAALGLLTSFPSLLSFSAQKTAALGQLIETDALLAPSFQKTVALGLLNETDALLSIAAGGAINVALGLLSELDSVFSSAATKNAALGLLTSAQSLLSPSAQKAASLGLLAENDVLFAQSVRKDALLGIIGATNTLLGLTGTKTANLGILTQTNALQSLTYARSILLGILNETDALTAVQVVKQLTFVLGILAEADQVFGIRPPRGLFLNPVGPNGLILIEAVKLFP